MGANLYLRRDSDWTAEDCRRWTTIRKVLAATGEEDTVAGRTRRQISSRTL